MTLKTLNLHLTNRCNMRCRHCVYSSGEQSIEEMNYPEIKKIINEFFRISDGRGTLNIFGGEVFLRKDIFRIINLALSKNLNVGITTNVNFSQDIIDKICRTKISRLAVDIDGANATSHDWLRNNKGHFEKTLKAIKCFLKAGIFTTSHTVLHKKNAKEVNALLKMGQKIGINFMSFYFFTSLGRGKKIKDLVIDPQNWIEIRKKIKKWANNNSPNFGIIWERSYEYVNKMGGLSSDLCRGKPADVVDVRCDGNVYLCGLLEAVDFGCLGNVKKETLRKILGRRQECAVGIEAGCASLAYGSNPEKLIDPRPSTDKIFPVCPYNWELLYGSLPDLKRKFAHIDSWIS
ncbi:MAG: radical SAM protein [Candidatus Nealsonbacteria bacterium]